MFEQTGVELVFFIKAKKMAWVPYMDHPMIGRIYCFNGRMATSLETLKEVINNPMMAELR